jgi:hypothetical protein
MSSSNLSGNFPADLSLIGTVLGPSLSHTVSSALRRIGRAAQCNSIKLPWPIAAMAITESSLFGHVTRRAVAPSSPHISQQPPKNGFLQSMDESPTSNNLRRASVMPTLMQKLYAPVKGSMRTTARAPTALAKRWTVRMDGVPLPLSMRATTLWVVPIRAATTHLVRPAWVRAAISSRTSSNFVHTNVWLFIWLNATISHDRSSIRMG